MLQPWSLDFRENVDEVVSGFDVFSFRVVDGVPVFRKPVLDTLHVLIYDAFAFPDLLVSYEVFI